MNSVSSASNRSEPAGQRVADPEQDLERLVGLEHAEDARHDAEHAGHRAARGELGRRRGRVQAAVARPLERDERRQLALEPEPMAWTTGMFPATAALVEDVARLERVGAVEDHVVAGDDPLDVGRRRASPRGRRP